MPNRPRVWETWTEQFCLANPTNPICAGQTLTSGAGEIAKPRIRIFKGGKNVKGFVGAGRKREIVSECAPFFNAKNPRPPSLTPYIAKLNLKPTAQVCEEIFVNPTESAFVQAKNLTTYTGQAQYIASLGSATIQFPKDSIEIKADWIPVKDFKGDYDCKTKKIAGVYTEEISTVAGSTAPACYALVGMHVSSKLFPNWLWATFEPQSPLTNPNRCNPNLFSQCTDPWGSNPAVSTGQNTAPTAALSALFTQSGIPVELQNYRLVGAITDYVDEKGNPRVLGNSFVEMSAGVPAQQASCITCHAYSQLNVTPLITGTSGNFGPFPQSPQGNIGTPYFPPSTGAPGAPNWKSLDFSYFLAVMPPTPPTTKPPQTAKKK